jgi:hypothetical protein
MGDAGESALSRNNCQRMMIVGLDASSFHYIVTSGCPRPLAEPAPPNGIGGERRPHPAGRSRMERTRAASMGPPVFASCRLDTFRDSASRSRLHSSLQTTGPAGSRMCFPFRIREMTSPPAAGRVPCRQPLRRNDYAEAPSVPRTFIHRGRATAAGCSRRQLLSGAVPRRRPTRRRRYRCRGGH